MKALVTLIKHILTSIDGETYDPARFWWALGLLACLALTGYEVYQTKHFDITTFALAYGGLLAAGAAGVKIKESSEPKAPE